MKLYADPAIAETGVTVVVGDSKEADDVFFVPMKMQFDWEKVLAQSGGMGQPSSEEMKGIFGKVTGSEDGSFHAGLASKGQVLGWIMGSETTAASALTMHSGQAEANQHVAYAMKKAGKDAAFMMSMDFREVMRQVWSVADAFGESRNVPKIGAGNAAPIAIYAGASGSRVTMGASVMFGEMAPIVRQLMRGRRR
jgi:hypothetical protein